MPYNKPLGNTVAYIKLLKIWEDEDVIELEVTVSSGQSSFMASAYVAHSTMKEYSKEFESFSKAIYGGIMDFQLGNFGHQFANGATLARLHFYKPGNISIETKQQTEYVTIAEREVTSECTMHLEAEPAQLDNFIYQFKCLVSGVEDEAVFQCV